MHVFHKKNKLYWRRAQRPGAITFFVYSIYSCNAMLMHIGRNCKGGSFSTCLVVLFLFVVACKQRTAGKSSEPQKPNIVFIMADDLGYGDLGVYGQKMIKTPRLDRMSQEGLRFTDFYAGSTVCAPSRCVLMTGQHTGRAHVRGNRKGDEPLPDSIVTVAEVLQDAGYVTGLIGKWGLGAADTPGAPNHQGFDYSYGYLNQRHAHNYYPEFLFRNHQKIKLPNVVANGTAEGAGVAEKKVAYSHSLIMEEALQFITRNKDRTFFLYLTPTLPHANNEGGDHGIEVPGQGIYAREDWPENEKNFAAMVSLLDEGVGQVLDRLKDLGIDDNTLVIFTSDNGPHEEGGHQHEFFDSNGVFQGKKRSLYEGGIRVPMIAWWPGKIQSGKVTGHVGYLGDVMATLAELAGVRSPDSLASVSFVPTLLGDKGQPKHDYLYWEFYEGKSQQAVRIDHWKAVRTPIFEGTMELYDLASDKGEAHNLADAHPDIIRRAETIMKEAHRPSPIWKKKGG